MLIRHLEFFVTLAEERHFGRAADLCGVSQPALSLAIRKLEADLGVVLVIRGARFVGLTPEGDKALAWGRRILASFGDLRDDLSGRRKGSLTGVLRLGVGASAMPFLPLFCERFEARNPLARIRAALLTGAEIRAGLAEFALDGGLGWLPPGTGAGGARDPLTCLPLWPGRLFFACRGDHPFASGGPLTLDDAATQPLCLVEDLPRHGLRPSVLCGGLDGVLAHLRGGRWCSVVPEGFAALLAPGDDLRLVELEGQDAPGRLGALLHPHDPASPMLRAFHDCAAALAADGPTPIAHPAAT